MSNWCTQPMNLDAVRQKMLKIYGDSTSRKLFVHRSKCAYGEIGLYFFALEGSGPKAWGVYCPSNGVVGSGLLTIGTEHGKKREFTNCRITGLEQLPDMYILD